jgi:hypothetical protein
VRTHFITPSVSLATLVLALVLHSAVFLATAAQEEGVVLFTEEDARALRVQENDWDPVPRARSAPLGPIISIRAPEIKIIDGGETIQTNSPTTMMVIFEENQAPVDMSSLEVKAKKGIFSKSLTDTLKPYIEGTTLAVDNIEVPSGKFQIEIVVKDLKGHETMQTYRLVVEKAGE